MHCALQSSDFFGVFSTSIQLTWSSICVSYSPTSLYQALRCGGDTHCLVEARCCQLRRGVKSRCPAYRMRRLASSSARDRRPFLGTSNGSFSAPSANFLTSNTAFFSIFCALSDEVSQMSQKSPDFNRNEHRNFRNFQI